MGGREVGGWLGEGEGEGEAGRERGGGAEEGGTDAEIAPSARAKFRV